MKRVIFASVALFFFAIAISLFQISCQKEALGDSTSNFNLQPATKTTLGGIIVGSGLNVSENGKIDISQNGKIAYLRRTGPDSNQPRELWTANYDGSNQKKLVFTGISADYSPRTAHISPDGEKLFITFWGQDAVSAIYSCNLDGGNLVKIIDGTGLGYEGLEVLEAY